MTPLKLFFMTLNLLCGVIDTEESVIQQFSLPSNIYAKTALHSKLFRLVSGARMRPSQENKHIGVKNIATLFL